MQLSLCCCLLLDSIFTKSLDRKMNCNAITWSGKIQTGFQITKGQLFITLDFLSAHHSIQSFEGVSALGLLCQ